MNVSAFAPPVRELVHQRAGGRCEVCGRAGLSTEIHHRLPRGAGGSKNPAKGRASNALLLCPEHHRYCETNVPLVYANGWKLKHGRSPVDVPALIVTPYGKGLWLLSDDGMYVPPFAA